MTIFQEICSALLCVQPSHSSEGGRGERLQGQGVRQGLAPGVLQMRGKVENFASYIYTKIFRPFISWVAATRQKRQNSGRSNPFP